jgi:hypothetical protein
LKWVRSIKIDDMIQSKPIIDGCNSHCTFRAIAFF